ncbi:MAG: TetR/AcrR family transcriptional regulator [Streptococcaceae bacterium]|jgi:AcrR family transcriptional regulator|nr:TetR/AcrR family transcriptional regulator [Streptococcaceae bacterium]
MKITQEKIVDAALDVAGERGLSNLTMKDIAAQLGIKTPSLYNHVASLGEVRELLTQRALIELTEVMKDAALGLSGKEALYAMAYKYRGFALRHPSLYDSVQWVGRSKSEKTSELSEKFLQIFEKILAPFSLTFEKKIQIIRVLRSYLHGFVVLDFEVDVDVEESFEYGLRLIIEHL